MRNPKLVLGLFILAAGLLGAGLIAGDTHLFAQGFPPTHGRRSQPTPTPPAPTASAVTPATAPATTTPAAQPSAPMPLKTADGNYAVAVKRADDVYQAAIVAAKKAAVKDLATVMDQAMTAKDLDTATAAHDQKKKFEDELAAQAVFAPEGTFTGSWQLSPGNAVVNLHADGSAEDGPRHGLWEFKDGNVVVMWDNRGTASVDKLTPVKALRRVGEGTLVGLVVIWVRP